MVESCCVYIYIYEFVCIFMFLCRRTTWAAHLQCLYIYTMSVMVLWIRDPMCCVIGMEVRYDAWMIRGCLTGSLEFHTRLGIHRRG